MSMNIGNNADDFYPTPAKLVREMLNGMDFNEISTVLEPSAGKGNIADVLKARGDNTDSCYSRRSYVDIDVIEKDEELRIILKGKGFRVVADDFLTFNSYKKYDLIIMNPPFSNGEKHLLKAIELQQKWGGKIVCLLNAETINNSYSVTRKDLVRQLDEYNADVKIIQNAFSSSEHSTNVEVALIHLDIPKVEHRNFILENLKSEQKFEEVNTNGKEVVYENVIKSIVAHCNFEIRAGINLIREYESLKPYICKSFEEEKCNDDMILELKVMTDRDGCNKDLVNEYVKAIRGKYWRKLFLDRRFIGKMTSNLQNDLLEKVKELRNYDFTEFNIKQIQIDMSKHFVGAVEDTIIALFDKLSHKYNWFDETSKNIHYYNGWKTNKAWVINKKCIIPCYRETWDSYLYNYKTVSEMADIEKALTYLDTEGDKVNCEDISVVLNQANVTKATKKIQCKYFQLTFYKKGTCHIEFTDDKLLKKFNIFGSQRKAWLPPSYGKVRYEDLDNESKQVVNEFDGDKEAYDNIVMDNQFYLIESKDLLMLSAGDN